MTNEIVYSVVVPLYNEELVINETYAKLKTVMDKTNENYEIIFVNDGSTDKSKIKIEIICKKDKKIKLVNFSRNFGHQAAISAGMNLATGKAIITIDADLQDPPEIILEMIKKWKDGYDVVYGKRLKRKGETLFKKITAKIFYRFLKKITNIDIPVDAGDFRLIDRRICDIIISLPEKNRYIRGLISWLGFKQTYVEFVRMERFAGETKYSFKKMIKLALDAITSFSYKPLIVAGYAGGISFLAGIILLILNAIKDSANNINILNLESILAINFIMFGIVLFSIGILGEYISRISDESKNRPLYIIDNIINYKRADKKNEIG